MKKLMALPVSIRSGGAAAVINRKYKMWGRCRDEIWAVSKVVALPQRESVGIKSWGPAAARTGQYEERGRCRSENRSV